MRMTPDHFNIHEAKTQLSRIVERVERGHEVTINRAGKPVAKVVPVPTTAGRSGRGVLKGRLVLAPDWDSAEVNAEIADNFAGGEKGYGAPS